MTKLEKNFIKKCVVEILEIEAGALACTEEDFDNSYAAECFAEEISGEIMWYINRMIDRNVNQNIIDQLKDLDWRLWNRNLKLYTLN